MAKRSADVDGRNALMAKSQEVPGPWQEARKPRQEGAEPLSIYRNLQLSAAGGKGSQYLALTTQNKN